MYLYADWLRHAARGGRKPTEAERAERVDLEREIPRDNMLRGAWLGLGLGSELARSREIYMLRGASWGLRRQPHPATARHPGLPGLPTADSGCPLLTPPIAL